jgi:hypothetical protein
MLKDPPKEPASKVAERRWRNKALTERFRKMKATREGAEQFPVFDGKKPFSTEAPKPRKEAPPKPAEVIENNDPTVNKFESRFLKDIRAMLFEHKQVSKAECLAAIARQKRRILLEKLRRLELAAREGAKS